ncbi:ATP-dependent helicase [Desulfobacterota bacterium AH_259_B03_O07]|nr:ATP-dependent helicase [Desulfobacterota bacterium AH_259_B03_O07]
MPDRRLFNAALAELRQNPEQMEAVHEQEHCVVLAGPGSGKTKTLTIAMARVLLDDVVEPRGIACITYNNECALELESRLARLGIEPSNRVFIGTVHSFALSQIIQPYARCVLPELPGSFRVATREGIKEAISTAHSRLFDGVENPQQRWRFAEEKRRRDVDRTHAVWRGSNPELADFVEAYEEELRRQGLIDFDDMPLLAARMIRSHVWIRHSLQAKFPVLFVDEYQDLGHALHELVLLLCFDAGVRLFAVGDPDQSIYGFTGANPELLQSLTTRPRVTNISLRFNYRCGTSIIDASMAALGEDRNYIAPDDSAEGNVYFRSADGDLDAQATDVIENVIPTLTTDGTALEDIAVLYRTANEGDAMAIAAQGRGIPIVRADNRALVRRNSRLSRFIEACAKWASGGWKDADPRFSRLAGDAATLVYGVDATAEEQRQIEVELMTFLRGSLETTVWTHAWLGEFRSQVLNNWRRRARTITEDWAAIDEMIRRTDPTESHQDMPLTHFGGRLEASGRLNLSTLHSAKGREFDAVVLFAMNNGGYLQTVTRVPLRGFGKHGDCSM